MPVVGAPTTYGKIFEGVATQTSSTTNPVYETSLALGSGPFPLLNGRYRLSARVVCLDNPQDNIFAFSVVATSNYDLTTAVIIPYETSANGCTIPGVGLVFFNTPHPVIQRLDDAYTPVAKAVVCYIGNPINTLLDVHPSASEFTVQGINGYESMYFPCSLASRSSTYTHTNKVTYSVERLA